MTCAAMKQQEAGLRVLLLHLLLPLLLALAVLIRVAPIPLTAPSMPLLAPCRAPQLLPLLSQHMRLHSAVARDSLPTEDGHHNQLRLPQAPSASSSTNSHRNTVRLLVLQAHLLLHLFPPLQLPLVLSLYHLLLPRNNRRSNCSYLLMQHPSRDKKQRH